MELCLLLENGVTHASFWINTKCEVVTVDIWEGEEASDKTRLFYDYTYYDGELKNERKINNFIQALEELRDGI